MLPIRDAFEFEYNGSDLVYGRGCIEQLEEKLDEYGFERALVVTGSNVGANPDVMEPVAAGLGDRMNAVFDETTPEKLAETAYDGIEIMQKENSDILIGVGGGSSLDIARQMSVFAADGRSLSELRKAARAGGLSPPNLDEPLTPVVVVPTTFAGADISSGGSIEILSPHESPTGNPVRTSGSITPEAMIYDPDLFETTPFGALAGSAMNGFNKGIETTYGRNTTSITDATAVQGLRLLHDALPRLPDNPEAMEHAVVGIILVQFERQISIIHAFGHGFSRRYNLQQGDIHAITVPHVLRYLFDHVFAGREVIAKGLGIDADSMTDEELAASIIAEVEAVRDALGLPTRLRELDSVRKEDLPAIAQSILDDHGIVRAPRALNPVVEEIEAVLRKAW